MQQTDIREKIQDILKNHQYIIQQIDDDELLPYILISLGKDTQGRDRFLKLMIIYQEMGQNLGAKDINIKNPVFNVVYTLDIPVDYHSNYAKDVASIINFINRQMPFPGFELDEMTDKIYLRHAHFITLQGLDERVIVSTVGLITMISDLFIPSIEEVASGKKQFKDVIEEIIQFNRDYLNNP